MNTPPNPDAAANLALFLLFAIVPLILILTGTVMGFLALRDIRGAHGSLGGAVLATFAAGLFPAMFILFACGAGLTLLGQKLNPDRSGIWLTVGCGIGVWLSFMMMRALHRDATGWIPPVAATPGVLGRSRLATAAIVLTIAGVAIVLLVLVLPEARLPFAINTRKGIVLVDLPVIIAGLICGVLSYREAAGKTCAWICGSLFAVLLILFAA